MSIFVNKEDLPYRRIFAAIDLEAFRTNLESIRGILPKGTNEDLPFAAADKGENRLLTAVNKWLIAHEEAGIEGAFVGLKGANLSVE